MSRAAVWAKALFKGWAASWLFLIWSALCVGTGAALGLSAAGAAFRAMLRSKGLLP